jgi:hypothetical protein
MNDPLSGEEGVWDSERRSGISFTTGHLIHLPQGPCCPHPLPQLFKLVTFYVCLSTLPLWCRHLELQLVFPRRSATGETCVPFWNPPPILSLFFHKHVTLAKGLITGLSQVPSQHFINKSVACYIR